MNLSNEDVQDILHVLDATAYDELKLETAHFRLRLRRSPGGQWTQETQVLASPRRSAAADRAVADAMSGAPATVASEVQPGATPGVSSRAQVRAHADLAASRQPGLHEVRPPMLGTFYRAPKPGADAFVEVGSKVQPETVVCIIETMKLMNSVCAGVAGEVVEICLADAQFADEAAVLLRIRPEATCG